MGGVGKTQVAIEYLYAHMADYASVFWISGATKTEFQSGFLQIATVVNSVDAEAGDDADAVVNAVLRWLKEQQSWLIVIDNLDDLSIAHGYLPETSGDGGHVLITTRNQAPTGIPAQGLEVGIFDPSQAVELLLLRATGTKHREPEIEGEARRIVNELGYLPLAIEQAAAFIRQSSLDLSNFLNIYSESRKEFLADLPEPDYIYPRALESTFFMSFQEVRTRNPDAAHLLNLFAFLNSDAILVDFLRSGHQALGEPLRSLLGNWFKFGKALGELGQFSLIQQSKDGQTLSVHRLIQDHLEPPRKRDLMTATVSMFYQRFHSSEKTRDKYAADIDSK